MGKLKTDVVNGVKKAIAGYPQAPTDINLIQSWMQQVELKLMTEISNAIAKYVINDSTITVTSVGTHATVPTPTPYGGTTEAHFITPVPAAASALKSLMMTLPKTGIASPQPVNLMLLFTAILNWLNSTMLAIKNDTVGKPPMFSAVVPTPGTITWAGFLPPMLVPLVISQMSAPGAYPDGKNPAEVTWGIIADAVYMGLSNPTNIPMVPVVTGTSTPGFVYMGGGMPVPGSIIFKP